MKYPLSGKVALVTGGSRSIGAAIVKRLAADGAVVALTYSTSPDTANDVIRAIESGGGKGLVIRADASDADAAKSAVAKTVQAFGRLDILVNNAGVAIIKPINIGRASCSDQTCDDSVAVALSNQLRNNCWRRIAGCSNIQGETKWDVGDGSIGVVGLADNLVLHHSRRSTCSESTERNEVSEPFQQAVSSR